MSAAPIRQDIVNGMKCLIENFREILSLIHDERTALSRQDWHSLEKILDDRQVLLNTSSTLVNKLMHPIQAMMPVNKASSFIDALDWLKGNIPAEDMDMHLYCGQLSVLATEINQQTRSLITALENHSPDHPHVQTHLVKLKPARQTVMVAELDQPD